MKPTCHHDHLRYRHDNCAVECMDCKALWAPKGMMARYNYLQTRMRMLESEIRDLKNQLGQREGTYLWDG